MAYKVTKGMLAIFNTFFALFSIVFLGIGISLIMTRIELQLSMTQLYLAVGLFITVSVLCMLVSALGCIGAFKEKTGFLSAYIGIVGILLVLQILVIGLAAAFSSKIHTAVLQEWLDADKTNFFPYNQLDENRNGSSDVSFSHALNILHVSFKCCGVNNYTDITDKNSSWSKAHPMYNNSVMQVPASCCNLTIEGANELAKSTANWKNFSSYLPKGSKCPTELADFHSQGCWSSFKETLNQHVTAIIVCSSLYILLYILCITLGCCLLRGVKSGYQRV